MLGRRARLSAESEEEEEGEEDECMMILKWKVMEMFPTAAIVDVYVRVGRTRARGAVLRDQGES